MRGGWAGQAPGLPAVASTSPLLSSFPGAGLLGGFGPGESKGRRANRRGSGHAGGRPGDQAPREEAGKGQMAPERLPAPTPTCPSLLSLPVQFPSSRPALLCSEKVPALLELRKQSWLERSPSQSWGGAGPTVLGSELPAPRPGLTHTRHAWEGDQPEIDTHLTEGLAELQVGPTHTSRK